MTGHTGWQPGERLTGAQADDLALAALPRVGSRWMWEPDKPHARQEIVVREVRWNGEEWWVLAGLLDGSASYWNDLSRFIEACVFVAPAEESSKVESTS